MSGTRRNCVGCNDFEDGSKCEGGNGKDGEEWADEEEEEDEKKERGWDDDEPSLDIGRSVVVVQIHNVSQQPIHISKILANGMGQLVA